MKRILTIIKIETTHSSKLLGSPIRTKMQTRAIDNKILTKRQYLSPVPMYLSLWEATKGDTIMDIKMLTVTKMAMVRGPTTVSVSFNFFYSYLSILYSWIFV